MRTKLGTCFMIAGILMVLSAVGLLVYNQWEAGQARKSTEEIMPQMLAEIEVRKQEKENIQQTPSQELENIVQEYLPSLTPPPVEEMEEVVIEGNSYIGYLSIPVLELDLPVMGDWSYPKLKKAACRYTGTVTGDDLVIMAHNYEYHFGRLDELAQGDMVFFTDAEGSITLYEVITRDILNPTAIEEVTGGEFDLVLFTCTYGGQSRVTVYCDRVKAE
jgi:sortase A